MSTTPENTGPVPLDRKGDFRAEIVQYGLQKKDSGAVGVRMQFKILECWNSETEEWEDWRPYNVEAWGTSWIVKKDNGGINQGAVESMVKNAGWDGNLASIVNNTWQPTPCQISTEENVYNGQTTYPMSFLNAWERVPGANVGNVTEDSLKDLQSRFGSSLRAVVGNIKRNTSPPAAANGKGGPKAPPAPKAEPKMETVPPEANGDDEIPF